MFLIWAETFILTILFVFLVKTFASHIMAWHHLHKSNDPIPTNNPLPPISVIKPVRGLDQEAAENFLSFIRSGYPESFEVLFSVEDKDDPVVPVIERLMGNIPFPESVRLIFSQRQDQREMGKTLNLMAGIRESSHEVLVFSDSDVRNTEGLLQALVRPLSNPQTGLVYACPAYGGARDWIAGLMALAVNETILALVGAPSFTAIGSAMALRKDVLHAIGGLAPIRHRIGMDAALGRAVRAKGYRIELITQPVTIIHTHSTFREWWQQMHRWLVTVRCYRNRAYLFALLHAFPIPWATLYLFLSAYQGRGLRGLGVWSFICSVRLASLALINLSFVREQTFWRYLWLAPILDLLKIPLWLEGYLNPYVVWRGRRYRVMADATVRPVS